MATIRTNPVYAALAYRRTIIHNLITFLKREYVGIDSDPPKKLICEEVLAVDSDTPVEEIVQYMEELEREHHELTIELSKFEFTKKGNYDIKHFQAPKKGHAERSPR